MALPCVAAWLILSYSVYFEGLEPCGVVLKATQASVVKSAKSLCKNILPPNSILKVLEYVLSSSVFKD
jgi:hypothetical protein